MNCCDQYGSQTLYDMHKSSGLYIHQALSYNFTYAKSVNIYLTYLHWVDFNYTLYREIIFVKEPMRLVRYLSGG